MKYLIERCHGYESHTAFMLSIVMLKERLMTRAIELKISKTFSVINRRFSTGILAFLKFIYDSSYSTLKVIRT